MKIDYWDENYSLKCKFVAEMKFQYRDENSSQLRSTVVKKMIKVHCSAEKLTIR